jgi:signal transduction histidine kinase
MVPLRVLLVDDSEQDSILLLRELNNAGFDPVYLRVDTAEGLERALAEGSWEIVLCDYIMPGFSGPAALKLLRRKGLDLPFIVVSGQIGEDTAVEAMRAGAHDYIMKGNLKRLGPAIKREIAEAESRRQRRKAEEDLRAKEEELNLARKMDKIKDEFIGMVSHELKTPLTVIIGAITVAGDERVPKKEARELIHDAIAQAEALGNIVDNLLELSRQQANRLILQTRPIDIGEIARSVILKLKERSSIHHLQEDVPPSLPRVLVDPLRAERILYNLVDNAIKYSPKGGEVRIFGRPEGDYLLMGVSDQGPGISREDQTRLFQSFERLGTKATGGIQGTGLGLRVCRILVEAHGGRIWVESEIGRGTTFFFTLPVSQDKGV